MVCVYDVHVDTAKDFILPNVLWRAGLNDGVCVCVCVCVCVVYNGRRR